MARGRRYRLVQRLPKQLPVIGRGGSGNKIDPSAIVESGRWPEQTAYCTAGQATKIWAMIVDAMEDEALAYHKIEGK